MTDFRRLFGESMPMTEYQALPALSAGGIHTLVEECPAKYWHGSPFNPDRAPEKKAAHFDIGTALHLAVLEPELLADRIFRIQFDDYRTKEARDLRDGAWNSNRVPLKDDEWEIVEGMAEAIRSKPDIAALFNGGRPEVTLTWGWPGLGIPCKARADYLSGDAKTIVDAKTAESANPRAIARKAYAEGWHVRAAWYREAVARSAKVVPRRYVFVVVEKTAPYIIQAFELDARAEEWGRQIIRAGLDRFQECRRLNVWPGYGEDIMRLPLPGWAEFQLADREQAGEFSRISAADARRSMEWMKS